jgi:hypothetical protein
MADDNAPRAARDALEKARQARFRAVAELGKRSRELTNARTPGEAREAAAAQERARAALRAARGQEKATSAKLWGAIAAKLGPDPLEQIASLDAGFPIALFPVRIETRFVRGERRPGDLLVRIYPDTITIDSHEPLLSEREIAAGQLYWRFAFGGAGEREAWRGLVRGMDPRRAAWVVEQLRPLNFSLLESGPLEPEFPEITARPDHWQRLPEAKLLPDRWIVSAFRDGELRHRVFGSVVREPLAASLTLASDSPAEEDMDPFALSDDGLVVDEAVRWTFDFAHAEAAGMAVRVPLDASDFELGFSRLLVLGVRASATPEEAASELAALLESHRHARGFAFVGQGSPTNNTEQGGAALPGDDPDGAVSFERERASAPLVEEQDGFRFMAALGVAAEPARHFEGAHRRERVLARAMATALWPATIGYFLEQMMAPVVVQRDVDGTKRHFLEHVSGRGVLPAFRVGRAPYGILPVGSFERWTPERGDDDVPARLLPLLRALHRSFRAVITGVPRLARSSDPDADMLAILGMNASSREVYVRRTMGNEARWNLLALLGVETEFWNGIRQALATHVLAELGLEDIDPRVLHLDYAMHAHRYASPLVADPTSETEPLPFDYIRWLRTAPIVALREERLPGEEPRPTALLYKMLRHAFLLEYGGTANRVLLARKTLVAHELRELELVGVVESNASTIWQRFEQVVPELSGNLNLADYLSTHPTRIDASGQPVAVFPGLAAHRRALEQLEGVPSAELERLFGETLDLSSHRLDAWIGSLFSERLARIREEHASGLYVGAYAWLEDLKPDPPGRRRPVVLPDGTSAQAFTDSGGYVYAPSMLHGAAAAVLRSAYLTRAEGEGGDHPYAIDLASSRVRTALWLLDGVRDDQPLGAALGYRFERGLHEGHPGLELDKFIAPFRQLYPLRRRVRRSDEAEPSESIAARNVVDGIQLQRAHAAGKIPWGEPGLVASSPERTAIERTLAELDDGLDAVKDLLTAESVYQALRGTPEGVGASLDTLSKGVRPPLPELARVPRSGTPVHHRVVLVFGASLSVEWQAIPATPRAEAEPFVDAWLSELLGRPDRLSCNVTFLDSEAVTGVRLSELGLRAIDFVLLAGAFESRPLDAELDRRVTEVATRLVGADRSVRIDYRRAGFAEDRPLSDALELARVALGLLGQARPLEPADLVPPETDASGADRLPAEASSRATVALARADATLLELGTAIDALAGVAEDAVADLTALRVALRHTADFGITAAFPATWHGHTPAERQRLRAVAPSALSDLQARRAAALAQPGPRERLVALFGRALPLVFRFRPAPAALLQPALDTPPDCGPQPTEAVEEWLAKLARVRPPLESWRRLATYLDVLERPLAPPRVAQLPLDAGPPLARWAALPFSDEAGRPRAGLLSLVLHGAPSASATEPWAGLMLDGFTERIPSTYEETGVVFHYDAPGNEAPNAVLLAVPPVRLPKGRWDYAALEATLHETLELAKIRGVDREQLSVFDQLAPMTYIAANPKAEAISTQLIGHLVAATTIVSDT